MKTELHEIFKVGGVGVTGYLATIQLADIAAIGSICVASVTTLYVGAKLFYLIKHGGKSPE